MRPSQPPVRRRLWTLVLALLAAMMLLGLGPSTASAAVNGGGHYVVSGSSVTYGDVVVWADSRFGTRQIYYKTLPGGAETRLSPGSVNQDRPAIYGNTIVWAESGNLFYKDISIDLPDGPPHALTDTASAAKASLQIFGDRVVWSQVDGALSQIYTKGVTDAGNGEVLSPDNGYNQTSPVIYGDYVVWVSSTVGGSAFDLRFKNLATGVTGDLCRALNDQSRPAIYGTVVAWEDGRDGVLDQGENILPQIYFYDLAPGPPADAAAAGTRLSATAGRQSRPAVVGATIFWLDARAGATGLNNIYKAAIGGAETQVTSDGLNRENPSIHQNLIYEEQPDGLYGANWDIILGAAPVPGALDSVMVTPAGVSLESGQTRTFFAQGHDASGNPVAASYDWTATGGTCAPLAGDYTTYTAGAVFGDYSITASSGGKTGFAAVNISSAPLAYVTITGPGDLEAGTTGTYSAQGYDAADNPIAGLTYAWSATGGTIPPAGASVSYTASTVSAGYQLVVSVTSGTTKTATKAVTVNPGPLDHISVTPPSAAMAPAGSQGFSAQGFDVYNNPIPGLVYGWTATGGAVSPDTGTSTVYTAGAVAGSFDVTVTSGSKSGSAAVTVNPTVPVYRFYNYLQGVHFYTTNTNEKNYLLGPGGSWTFRLEGEAFSAYAVNVTNSARVYRFYNFLQGVHFYTANEAEAANVRNTATWTFREEGVAYHAYPSEAAAAPLIVKPVYRFYNFLQGVHFYTANAAEATNVRTNLSYMYRDEGIAYYVE